MTRISLTRAAQAAAILTMVFATTVEAQSCRGLSRSGGIAYMRGQSLSGVSNGVAASLAGGRFAVDGSYGSLTADADDISGMDASLRFSMLFGGSNFKFCPSLGFLYNSDEWQIDATTNLTQRTVSGRLGVGFGYEWEAYPGLSLVPFASVDYDFSGFVFTLDADDGEDELSGDTLSRASIQYGVAAQYRMVFLSYAAERYSDTKGTRPHLGRLLVGVSLGGWNSSSSRRSPTPKGAKR